jgi:hypothetical protein
MRDRIQRVYSIFMTRVHRSPRSGSTDSLPVLIGSFDLPVPKRDRATQHPVLKNDGLHFHGILLVPPVSRLKSSVEDHFAENADMYTDSGRLIERIHIRPALSDLPCVTDYAFKAIKWGRLSYDDAVVILPRSRQELTA